MGHLFLVVLACLAFSVFAETPIGEIQFENGNTLELSAPEYVHEDTKFKPLLVFHPLGKPSQLKDIGWVSFFPVTNTRANYFKTPNLRLYSIEDGPTLAILGTNQGFYFFTQEGKYEQLPIDLEKIKKGKFATSSFIWGKNSFRIFSVEYVGPPREENSQEPLLATGETFIIRDDGVFLRLDYKFHPKEDIEEGDFSIRDDILIINECLREIDLRAFDVEATLQIRPPMKVTDQKGTVIQDPIGEVLKTYPDIAAKSSNEVMEIRDLDLLEEIRIGIKRSEKKSVVLLGEPGVGKTKFMHAFARMIREGKIKGIPRTMKVLAVEKTSLGAGAKFIGVYEARIKMLIEASQQLPIYLFIDEIDTLRGDGTHSNSKVDAIDMIRSPLGEGYLRLLATSNKAKYNAAFGGDSAFKRRVLVTTKKEPDDDETLGYIQAWFQHKGKTVPREETLRYAMALSKKFASEGANPDRTINFLDYAQAFAQDKTDNSAVKLNSKILEQAVLKFYKADTALIDAKVRVQKLDEIKAYYDKYLIGLDNVSEAMLNAVARYFAGAYEEGLPPVRLLLAGPPGTGKTLACQILAKVMGWKLKRIAMNNYKDSSPKKLLQEIAEALRETPYTILLLDEFNMASLEVQAAILEFLDSGEFTVEESVDSSSNGAKTAVTVKGHHAFVVATSNAGTDYLVNHFSRPGFGFNQYVEKKTIDEDEFERALLGDGVQKAVLDRFPERIPVFGAIKQVFKDILLLHIQKFALNMQAKAVLHFENLDQLASDLTDQYYKEGLSNRKVHKIILDHFTTPLSHYLVRFQAMEKGIAQIYVQHKVEGKKIRVSYANAKDCRELLKAE